MFPRKSNAQVPPQSGRPATARKGSLPLSRISETRSHLRRLSREFYQGNAYVHWTMTIKDRKTGWLSARSHREFREIHLHTLSRYGLICPVYCCMLDHLHLFWIGLEATSDQILASAFFRRHFNRVLRTSKVEFQQQGYDHVLGEKERARGAVEFLIYYIAQNSVRARLIGDSRAWEFSGSQAIGFPDLDWRRPEFSSRFWKVYGLLQRESESRSNPATQKVPAGLHPAAVRPPP